MKVRRRIYSCVLLMLSMCGVSLAQVQQQNRSLVVNGHTGEALMVQISGRNYVDLETLARIANGSLGFHGNQITLTLPAPSVPPPATNPEPVQPAAHSGLSQHFMMAGIETIAQMREWATTLAYAIQNGYGVTEGWAAKYREQAANSLRLASAAVSTDSDRDALQLLTNEFDAVREWSDRLVEAKKSMDTAKYAMSPDALRNESLSQKIITCAHFLGGMLESGEFNDDSSCH